MRLCGEEDTGSGTAVGSKEKSPLAGDFRVGMSNLARKRMVTTKRNDTKQPVRLTQFAFCVTPPRP